MKKIIFVTGLALMLAGCQTEEEAQQYHDIAISAMNERLPDGCKIMYDGEIPIVNQSYPVQVVHVSCSNADTTTTNTQQTVRHGKSTTTINGVTYEITPINEKEKEKNDQS